MQRTFDEIKKSIKKTPKEAHLHREMGSYCLNIKNFKDAVSEYKIAAGLSPRVIQEIVIDFEQFLQANLANVDARLALVEFYLSLGDTESAVVELEELVEIAPETAYVYNLLGRIYLRLGRLEGAIALLEKALKAGKGDVALLEALASAYLEKARYADAISIYEELCKDDPKSKRVQRTLRELYIRIKDFDGAARVSSQMLSNDAEILSESEEILKSLDNTSPKSPYIKEQLAKIYIMSLKPGKAVDQLEKIVKIDPQKIDDAIGYLKKILITYPDHFESMFLLAELLTNKGGNFSEAVELLNKAVLLNPELADKAIKSYKSIISAYPKQAMAHQSLAEIYMMKGQIKEALEEFMHVVRINPEEIEKIEKKCKEILRSDPKMYVAYLVQAEAFLAKGEMRKAISIAEELIEKDKNNINAFLIAGEAYSKIGIWARSRDAFKRALKLSPHDIAVHNKYLEAYEKNMEVEISAVKSKIEQDPWRIALNLDLAKLLFVANNQEAAIRSLQNAAKDPGRAPFAHNLMGIIFKEQGRFDLAQVQFEKALEYKNIEDLSLAKSLKANLGSAYEAMGNIEKAISLYEDVISQDIEFGQLNERIKNLNHANPAFLRNKMLGIYFFRANSDDICFVWGEDNRKNKESDYENLTLLSFGAEQNFRAFENAIAGHLATAQEEFVLSTQLDQSAAQAINNLAAIYMKNKNYDNASLKLSEAISLDNLNAVYHNNSGVLNFIKGDIEGARREFKNSLKINKNLNVANFNMGDIEMKQRNIEEGLICYKKIKQFDPLYEAASRRLKYWD